MTTPLSTVDLFEISGGDEYPYLERQFGTLLSLAFLAGAVGSGAALAGAFVVGGLMLVDACFQ